VQIFLKKDYGIIEKATLFLNDGLSRACGTK